MKQDILAAKEVCTFQLKSGRKSQKMPTKSVEDIIDDFLKRVTYKPGFKIYAKHVPLKSFVFVTSWQPNSKKPNKAVAITNQNVIHHFDLQLIPEEIEEVLRLKIQHIIERYEQHEIDEWLKIDGKNVNNPHPEMPS